MRLYGAAQSRARTQSHSPPTVEGEQDDTVATTTTVLATLAPDPTFTTTEQIVAKGFSAKSKFKQSFANTVEQQEEDTVDLPEGKAYAVERELKLFARSRTTEAPEF